MPATLIFGIDGILRDGDRELARVEPGNERAYARVSSGSRTYDIARKGREGWHFSLLDPSGARTLAEFRPARLGRGGVIAGENLTMHLRSHLLKARHWTISSPEGMSAAIACATGLERVSPDGASRVVVTPTRRPELVLSELGEATTHEGAAPMLAFACWLIVEWELMPSGGMDSSGVGP
jgi:hypothetical protein